MQAALPPQRFPVLVYDRDARAMYKSGGLAAKAKDVADAGRFDDTHIIHVTDDELEMLRQQWGDPTINPHTGMPEFGLFGSIFKVLKKIAPLAAFAVPVIGPALGTALGVGATAGTALAGAGLGALSGGGLKGAALGALTGGLGASGAAGKLGGTILGQGASQATKNALGQALIGGGVGALGGQDPLMSALGGAAQGYLMTPRVPQTSGTAAAGVPATTSVPEMKTAAPATMSAQTTGAIPSSVQQYLDNISAPMPGTTPSFTPISSSAQPYLDRLSAPMPEAASLAAPTTAAVTKPNFWNQNFLGLGIKNKYAIPGIIGAAALADALKPKEDTSMPSQEAFFGPEFSSSSMNAPGNFRLASLNSGISPESAAAEYAKRYFTGFAMGGDVGHEGREGAGSFAVRGPGTGRSDEIPAMLSDGEYVMDAETVALLGDGSSKAGAKKLDDLRVKIRKHKGKKLAKGKFSHDAKAPERYMAGGRI